jgi:hypothetical protein
MVIGLLVCLAAGFWAAYTGPAFEEFRRKRSETKDFPLARVMFFLPSAVRHETCMEDPTRLP